VEFIQVCPHRRNVETKEESFSCFENWDNDRLASLLLRRMTKKRELLTWIFFSFGIICVVIGMPTDREEDGAAADSGSKQKQKGFF
jgi:hypothetical protein